MAALRLDTLLSLRHLWAERLEFPITCEVCWRRCRPARRSLQAEQGGLSVLRVLRHICLYVARSPMSGGGLPWGDLLRQAAWCCDPKTPHCLCPICPFHTTHTPRRARARMAGGLQRKTPVPHPCTGASPLPLALWPSPETAGLRGSPDAGPAGVDRARAAPGTSAALMLFLLGSALLAEGSSRPQLPSCDDETPGAHLAQVFHGQLETPKASGTGLSSSLCLCGPASQRGASPSFSGKARFPPGHSR